MTDEDKADPAAGDIPRDRIQAAEDAVEDPGTGDWYAVGWWFEQGYIAGMKDPASRRSSP